MTDDPRIDRMAGCACFGKGMLAIGAVVLAALCLLNLNQCFFMTDRGSVHLQVRTIVKDLRIALMSYEIEYNHFPIPEASSTGSDISFRSRGPMLPALAGEEVGGLNPRKIKFIDFLLAEAHKHGLWQDGDEYVLSDLWGESYYIVLDTNGDNKIANPEFGADQSHSDYAKRCQANPPPQTLSLEVLIYSSGKDRDPKTWNDNICSWRN